MLLLTRSIGKSIDIGDDVKVTVIDIYEINGSRHVKLGIDAPLDVLVDREEVRERRIKEGWDR